MIRQSVKDIYYLLLRPLSRILRSAYRLRYRRRKKLLVQLGCGKNYIPGFVNIDGNVFRKSDCVLDVTVGLPFADGSVDFLYSCHMLEHLYIDDAIVLLRECRRVLSPGGYARFTLPDAEFAIKEILQGNESSSFPRPFESRMGQAMNFLFCDGQHRFGYSFEIMRELASRVGFEHARLGVLDEDPNMLKQSEPSGSFVINLYA